jgi:hypothetical protein
MPHTTLAEGHVTNPPVLAQRISSPTQDGQCFTKTRQVPVPHLSEETSRSLENESTRQLRGLSARRTIASGQHERVTRHAVA